MSGAWSRLNVDQRRELRHFAHENGRTWKSKLLTMWGTGRDDRHPYLRQIRNRIGPSGLLSIKPKDLEVPMPIKHNFAVVHIADSTPIFVTYGEEGWSPCTAGLMKTWQTLHEAQSPEVTEAARAGSMFGWEAPAAKAAKEYATGVVTEAHRSHTHSSAVGSTSGV